MVILILILIALDVFFTWMIWRLNLYVAKLEKLIEDNQELTQNLLITLKTLAPEGMIDANGVTKKIRIQQS